MGNSIDNASVFLIQTLFDLYLFILTMRLLLCFARADYFNPLSQFVMKLTHPLIVPVRRMIPTIANIEFATLFFILLFEMIKYLLVALLSTGVPPILSLMLLSFADMLRLIINVYFYAILIQAILSWVQPGAYSPVAFLLGQMTAPIMRPLHRLMPPIAGFDLSPIAALILLQVALILFVNPLLMMGMRMT